MFATSIIYDNNLDLNKIISNYYVATVYNKFTNKLKLPSPLKKIIPSSTQLIHADLELPAISRYPINGH